MNNLIEWLTNARDTLDKLVEASRFVVEKRKKDMEAGNNQVYIVMCGSPLHGMLYLIEICTK